MRALPLLCLMQPPLNPSEHPYAFPKLLLVAAATILSPQTSLVPSPLTRPALPTQGPVSPFPQLYSQSPSYTLSSPFPSSQYTAGPQRTPSGPSLLPASPERCEGQTSLLPYLGICLKVSVRAELKISGIQVKLQTQTGSPGQFLPELAGKRNISERRNSERRGGRGDTV